MLFRADHHTWSAVGKRVLGVFVATTLLTIPAVAEGRAPDRDHDGLSNRVELKRYKTSPRKRDTDRDGLSDGAEVRRYRTKPRRRDTDRDGLRDGAEVKRFKTNPRRKDTDRDGLSDRAEIKRYKTNPRRKDTDGDGLGDGAEVLMGLNPRVPNKGVPGIPGRPVRACGPVVSSLSALQSAVSRAGAGSVICLADGSYGSATLSGPGPAGVVVQAQRPGAARVGGVTMGGSNLTVAGLSISGGVTIRPGSQGMTVEYNRITGGGQGLDMATSTTPVTDVAIRGNQFVGPFGEDAIRLNGYRDGPDADSAGVLIEGNEITGVRENGSHSDCLQGVWRGDSVVFRGNYVHDNRCQGFFLKDQQSAIASVVVEDNLFVRNNMACAAGASGCGQPVSFQVFGPVSNFRASHNTVWGFTGDMITLRGSGWGRSDVTSNVAYKFWSDSSSPFSNFGASSNIGCDTNRGSWPAAGWTRNCSPGFRNPGADDYRVPGGQGVTWAPGERAFGP